MMIKLTCRR